MNAPIACPDYSNCQQRCNETTNGIGWGIEHQLESPRPYRLISPVFPSRCLAITNLPQYRITNETGELRVYEQLLPPDK